MHDMPPEVLALRLARQRATLAREAAERTLRDAERAEAELVVQEEHALAAVAVAERERLTARYDVADTFTRKAADALAVLHLKIRSAASTKSRAEARLAALQEEMLEQQHRIRAAETAERKLQSDLGNVERAAEACREARSAAEAALRNLQPADSPAPASFAQRIEDRRVTERRTTGIPVHEPLAV